MSLAEIHTGFAGSLFDALAGAGERNVVVSPWSVSSALAVLAAGVDDAARREIEHVLAAGVRTDVVLRTLASGAAQVARNCSASDAAAALAVANTLWVDESCTPSPGFLPELTRWPGAAVRTAPMRSRPDDARAAINADVARTTRQLIPEVLPYGSLRSDDRAVVVNALYLLAGWLTPFADELTVDEPFHGVAGDRNVPTMRGAPLASYARADAEYVALPLMPEFTAEIVVPAPERLDVGMLAQLRRSATQYRVDLHLPRFSVGSSSDVTAALRQLGVAAIFDRRAARLVVEELLIISNVFHGAVLRVDESGVEGAAATGAVATGVAFHQHPEVEVRIDRPFLFLVSHAQTKAVLFAARVTNPL